MGWKKNFILPLFLLIIIVGVLGVVNAANSLNLINPVGGNYYKGTVSIQWSYVGTPQGPVRISYNDGSGWTFLDQVPQGSTTYSWNTDGKNGNYQVYIYERDTGADVTSGIFIIDNTLPTSSVSVPDYQNSLTFNVPFLVTDSNPNFVELWYKKDSGSWTKYGTTFSSSPISFTSTGDGVYGFYTIATDKAGNIESSKTNADDTIRVDTVKPTTTDDYTLTGWQSSDKIITLTPIDPTPSSGIEWTKYCIDQAGTCTPTIVGTSVTVSAEGTNYFRYASRDNAGNVQVTKEKIVKIDKTVQTVGVSGAPSGFIVSTAGATAGVTCTDSLSGCNASSYKFKFYDSNPVTCSNNYAEYTSINPVTGHKWVCAAAKDVAGNTGFSSPPVEFTIFNTIQSAIDAITVPGTIINVAAGDYDEQVVIDESLTLQGAGDTTIIKPSSSAKLTSLYTLGTQTGASWNGHKLASIISVSNANNVIIKDLKVDGESLTSLPTGANYVVGVSYGETSGTISNVKAVNMNKIPEAVRTYGIWLDAVSTTASVEVKNSNINLYNKNGINARGATLTVNIHDNIIIGPGSVGVQVPNGILFAFGAGGNASHNTVSQNHYTGSTWLSAGIMGYYAKDYVTIDHNEIYDIDMGIAPSSYSSIHDNNIHNCLWGIELESGSDYNNITSNLITNNNQYGIQLLGPGSSYYSGSGDEPGPNNFAHYNTLVGNTLLGIKNWVTQTFNAKNNWWGTNVGSEIATKVSANVDYTPFAEDNSLTRFYAPILGAIGGQSVNEGSTLTITLSATDADAGDTLAYNDNVEFGSLVGNVFTWAPTGANQGSHTVTFTVSDGSLTDSETITITVNNVAPTVEAGAGQTVNEGVSVSFSGTATDAGGDTLTYSWNFGDSGTGTGQSTTHTYADNGIYIYIVTLSVNDGTTITTDTLTVTVNNVAPTITTLTSDKAGGIIGEIIQFTVTATDPAGVNDPLTYSWNFGDTQTSTLQNPTHSYSSRGTYIVTLTVSDGDGGSDTETLTILVNDLIWDLASEWNLVSVPKTLTVNSKSALLPGNAVWSYDGSWVNPTTINPGVGYWVDNASLKSLGLNYAGECNDFPRCLLSGKINIAALNNEWNMVGLTTTNPKQIKDAFGSSIYNDTHLPVYEVVSYNGTDFNFMGPDDTMIPGKGYWVYVWFE